jgi:hypothetical protein
MDTSSSSGTSASEALVFLQKDYELKARYLADHYTRMWTRFNFFMVATTGIATVLFSGLQGGKTLGSSIAFLLAGMVLALCWYVFGAQDRYHAEAYRQQIERIARALDKGLGLSDELARFTTNPVESKYWPVNDVYNVSVCPKLYQWRIDWISITKLAAIFPFVLFLCWIGLSIVGLAKWA